MSYSPSPGVFVVPHEVRRGPAVLVMCAGGSLLVITLLGALGNSGGLTLAQSLWPAAGGTALAAGLSSLWPWRFAAGQWIWPAASMFACLCCCSIASDFWATSGTFYGKAPSLAWTTIPILPALPLWALEAAVAWWAARGRLARAARGVGILSMLIIVIPVLLPHSYALVSPRGGGGGAAFAPNIYLYPASAEQVVATTTAPQRITRSRPAYGRGWSVFASPDGAIAGVPAGYLFYDADVSAAWQTSQGWLVASSDWQRWMKTELPRLGLNPRETADFERAWTGTLPSAPYYLVAPQSQSTVDAAMPLAVSPQPAAIYRLWFDIEPLQTPVTLAAPTGVMVGPRRGFTVVEWGVVMVTAAPRCVPEATPDCG